MRTLLAASLLAILILGCSQSSNDAADAGPGPACNAGTFCPGGSVCYYRLGDCSGEGRCFPFPKNPECGIVSSYCGCNGSAEVYERCGDPEGYASAPTTGENIAFCPVVDSGAGSGPMDAAPDVMTGDSEED